MTSEDPAEDTLLTGLYRRLEEHIGTRYSGSQDAASARYQAWLASRTRDIDSAGDTPKIVIAVDGPSGTGKSSAARGVARELSLRYLDTGAMYRALTWWLLDRGVDITDSDAIRAHLRTTGLIITVSTDPDDPWTKANGRDISAEIRTREVSVSVSVVARVPEVRDWLISQQRVIITRAGIVAEGRDIGTVVAPDADVKVFLTADATVRALRHSAELGTTVVPAESDQDRRDRLDAAHSAMAPDAVLLDSSDLSLPEAVAWIVELIHSRIRTDKDVATT